MCTSSYIVTNHFIYVLVFLVTNDQLKCSSHADGAASADRVITMQLMAEGTSLVWPGPLNKPQGIYCLLYV